METLRSPPELTGPAFGFSNLTFRAWFEAQFGTAAWKNVTPHPAPAMDGLSALVPAHDRRADRERDRADRSRRRQGFVVLDAALGAGTRKVAARRVVLANGREGLGGPYVRDVPRARPRFVAHSSDDIDFDALRGKTVGVIGAGASASTTPPKRWSMAPRASPCWCGGRTCRASTRAWASAAPASGSASCADPRTEMADRELHRRAGGPAAAQLDAARDPPQEFFDLRALRAAAVEIENGRVLLDTTRGRLGFDFLILATGLTVDWGQRPELASLEAAYPALGRSFHPGGPRRIRAGGPPVRRARVRVPRAQTRHRAMGEPHSLLHLPGLSESWSDLGRHSGDQRRGGAGRDRRREPRCSPKTTSGRGGAWSDGATRSCAATNTCSTTT